MEEKKNIVMMYGYPATGKTFLSRKIEEHLREKYRVKVLSTLDVRKELGLFDLESGTQRDFVYTLLSKRVGETMKAENYDVVIIDGNFNERKRREMFYSNLGNFSIYIVHCFVSDEKIIWERMNERQKNISIPENKAATMNLYNLIKNSGDDVNEDEIVKKGLAKIIRFDSGENCMERISKDDNDKLIRDIISIAI